MQACKEMEKQSWLLQAFGRSYKQANLLLFLPIPQIMLSLMVDLKWFKVLLKALLIMCKTELLANEIIEVSKEISDDFFSAYLLLSETPVYNSESDTMVTIAEYEDYLESISLQLIELRHK